MAQKRGLRKLVDDSLKGRIAEAIIELMFKASGMRVYYLGFEWKQQHLFQRSLGRSFDETLDRLCDMPDFVIENTSEKHEFVEIKYRQQGRFVFTRVDAEEIEREKVMIEKLRKGFWRPTIILVSYNTTPRYHKDRFQVLKHPYELEADGNPINPISVLDNSDWKVTKEAEALCIEHVDLVFKAYRERDALKKVNNNDGFFD